MVKSIMNAPQSPPTGSGHWEHCTIHLNTSTGEIHTDGDETVKYWIQSKIKGLKDAEEETLRYRTALAEARARIADMEKYIVDEALRKART